MLAVRINNISYSMNEKKILNNINLQLEKEKIACILGPSGCGKTTLLKLIAGLSKVQEGEIFLNENLVSSSNIHLKTEKRKIGFLFQDYALFPHQTVKQKSHNSPGSALQCPNRLIQSNLEGVGGIM